MSQGKLLWSTSAAEFANWSIRRRYRRPLADSISSLTGEGDNRIIITNKLGIIGSIISFEGQADEVDRADDVAEGKGKEEEEEE